MHLAFLGTPEASVPSLRAVVALGHDVELVITRTDRRRGRGSELSPSPVKAAALELGLRVAHRLSDLDGVDVERGVVVAYGAMIPADLLTRVPMLNVHFSLLPRWRGAAPVERAILAGDRETGVCVMTLEPELDTGPVHLERRTTIDDKDAHTLTSELARLGALALVEVLSSEELLAHPSSQVGEATYAAKLTKETFHVAPTMTSTMVVRTVRLGRAFTYVHGTRLGIETASIASELLTPGTVIRRDRRVLLGARDGAVALETVRASGARSMSAQSWWDGARLGDTVVRWT